MGNEERIMPRMHLFAWMFAGAIGAQVGLAQPGAAFECPEPQAQGVRGVIPESPQQIAELSALLRAGDLENRIEVIAHDLKQNVNLFRDQRTRLLILIDTEPPNGSIP
jgi:hypothetical protein